MRASILAILILGGIVLNIKAQFSYNEKGQAIPPASQPFGKEAFGLCDSPSSEIVVLDPVSGLVGLDPRN